MKMIQIVPRQLENYFLKAKLVLMMNTIVCLPSNFLIIDYRIILKYSVQQSKYFFVSGFHTSLKLIHKGDKTMGLYVNKILKYESIDCNRDREDF